MHVSSRFVAGVAGALMSAHVVLGEYALDVSYDASNFFDSFDFFTDVDPTEGFVEYVDAATAKEGKLAEVRDGFVHMGVDHTTVNPPNGRRSVRLTSKESFTHGLFIADISHMPGSICGVWPAYWMFGPSWPSSGEIDILEGVNSQSSNLLTLHTGSGCTMSNEGGLKSTVMKNPDCGSGDSHGGCPQQDADDQSYGTGFNNNHGGVYATEWTSDHIAIWFFPRHRIPKDITSGNPKPSSWSQPTARFLGGNGCDIDSHFQNNNLVFDTTFCGAWAGSSDVWGSDPVCSATGMTCKDYVSSKPEEFKEAHWTVKSVKVYQKNGDGGHTDPPPSTTSEPASLPPVSTSMPTETAPAATSYLVPSQPDATPQPVQEPSGDGSPVQEPNGDGQPFQQPAGNDQPVSEADPSSPWPLAVEAPAKV